MERIFVALAALFGLVSVIADAAVAHVLAGDPTRAEWAATAARYGLAHAAALLAMAALLRNAAGGTHRGWLVASACCFGAALVAFCGGLFLLAAGAGGWLLPVVPVGGTLFIAGWAALLLHAVLPRPPV